jgi:hypothetical protein
MPETVDSQDDALADTKTADSQDDDALAVTRPPTADITGEDAKDDDGDGDDMLPVGLR